MSKNGCHERQVTDHKPAVQLAGLSVSTSASAAVDAVNLKCPVSIKKMTLTNHSDSTVPRSENDRSLRVLDGLEKKMAELLDHYLNPGIFPSE